MDLQSGYFDIHDLVRPLLFSYLRGRIAARLGDLAEARRMAAAIRAAPVPTGRERWREQLARGVELEEAIATGSAGGMLGRLDPLGAFSDYESSMFSPFYSLAAERHARAGLLEEAGRPEEALVAYASFEHFNLFDRVYAASANLRAGALLEDLGRAREAEARYRRVLVLYTDPDPPLRELRRQAEAGLARLAADGSR